MNASPLGLMQVVASAANLLPICAVADADFLFSGEDPLRPWYRLRSITKHSSYDLPRWTARARSPHRGSRIACFSLFYVPDKGICA
jgi:hypothetical protein